MDPQISIFVVNLVISAIVAACTAFFTIGKYKERVDTLKDGYGKLEEKTVRIKTSVDQLLEFKTQTQKFIDKNIYKDQSPLSLTELGEKLVTESGFSQIFDKTKDNLVEMLEEQAPTSQYDVQEKARALMDDLDTYQPFQSIKTYAFNNGKDFNQILRAGGILLRDYYFEKHPELINPKEDW